MTVPTHLFIAKMLNLWTDYGNVISEPLKKAWVQLCETFNDKVRASTDPREEEMWRVISPPTGSGKTQGMIVYAALLSQQSSHPGMLIVTRMIEDADKIANQINELAKKYSGINTDPQAVSYHSEKKSTLPLKELSKYPVLVITHAAYKVALDRLSVDSSIEGTWVLFYTFRQGRRKLVVIDEAIDLVDYSEITVEEVKALLYFSDPIKGSFPLERSTLEAFRDILEALEKKKDVKHKEMILVDRPAAEWCFMMENAAQKLKELGLSPDSITAPDFKAFKESLRSVRYDTLQFKKDAQENMRMKQKCLDIVSAVDSLLRTYIFYSKNNSKPTFNTARLLVPPEAKGAVIMDATATCNVIYELFDRAQKIEPPPDTRDYSNVTLKVSYDHKVGSRDMSLGGVLDHCHHLVSFVDNDLARNSSTKPSIKALAITHKDVEPFLTQCIPDNFMLSVTHWGAIDGKNDWNDHEIVIVYGLPYKPKRWSSSVFMALQGVQDNSWLHDPSRRKFQDHMDIRAAISTGQMVSDIVQGINRVRCRKVIDPLGNCPKTDVYLLLSTRGEAAPILEGIKREMPGIKIVELKYQHQKQKKRGKRGKYHDSLTAYLKTMRQGDRLSASTIQKALQIPETSWKKLVHKLKNTASPLSHELQALCVQYFVQRTGKTSRAFFLKAAV